MNYYLEAFKKYAVFTGRARRKEYWMFFLFNMIFMIVAVIIDSILGTSFEYSIYGLVAILYVLAMIVPSLSITVRRLHDIDKSGWYYFLSLIPIIGSIWLLILLCKEGDKAENKYGADPKAA